MVYVRDKTRRIAPPARPEFRPWRGCRALVERAAERLL
jgi:hypothetical protein